jgi:hypothetical protein
MNDSVLVRTPQRGVGRGFAKLSGKPIAEVGAAALRSVTAGGQSYMQSYMQPYMQPYMQTYMQPRSRSRPFALFGII